MTGANVLMHFRDPRPLVTLGLHPATPVAVLPTDPLALGGAVVILLVIGALAAFAPARRASLTDPAVVLRQP